MNYLKSYLWILRGTYARHVWGTGTVVAKHHKGWDRQHLALKLNTDLYVNF